MESGFALFVDVMGVQRELVSTTDGGSTTSFEKCRDRLNRFHGDLETVVGERMPMWLSQIPSAPQPNFVAEFSDSAYIVGERFASVAIPALFLMRLALRHEYPLRGGIGIGSFSHEASGARTDRGGQIWSTSSFLGGAIVTAYQAERSATGGLRIFVHPLVVQQSGEPLLKEYTVPLLEEETKPDATHELRIWRAREVEFAASRFRTFRDKQNLPERAVRHYEATIAAYERFGKIHDELPHVLPAMWL